MAGCDPVGSIIAAFVVQADWHKGTVLASVRGNAKSQEVRISKGPLVSTADAGFRQPWREVIGTFLKIGVLSYGGAASMGIMQTEVQERRAWLPKEQFVEGLALVNTLPGPAGIQLGIFLGYTRAGWLTRPCDNSSARRSRTHSSAQSCCARTDC